MRLAGDTGDKHGTHNAASSNNKRCHGYNRFFHLMHHNFIGNDLQNEDCHQNINLAAVKQNSGTAISWKTIEWKLTQLHFLYDRPPSSTTRA